jgi:hypothetical protein
VILDGESTGEGKDSFVAKLFPNFILADFYFQINNLSNFLFGGIHKNGQRVWSILSKSLVFRASLLLDSSCCIKFKLNAGRVWNEVFDLGGVSIGRCKMP